MGRFGTTGRSKPPPPIAVSILSVLTLSESFSAIWPELASELDAELRVVTSAAELSLSGDALPPIIVIAGAESVAEAEVRAVCAMGARPIVIGMEADHRLAVAILHAGAADYFALPADLEVLRSSLAAASERTESRARGGSLLETYRSEYDFGQIVGSSPAIRATLQRAARIIPHGAASILITGETGTGKELLARAIHFNGPRGAGAFVEINCAAIPAGLLESELFGFERGAFTDARNAKPGLFETADGGTLFLDEIGHLPHALQGKLLKAIEEKRIRRLGSVRSLDVDVRIIAATNVDLEAAVQEGNFREDLYYRLTIIPLQLPPLRDRGADVVLLAEHLLRRLGEQYGLNPPPVTESLRTVLLAHSWPGNVRELRNALERAMLLGEGKLNASDLFLRARRESPRNPSIPFPAPLEEIVREAARATLDLHRGNKRAAADALGISRSRLYRLLEDGVDESSQPTIDPQLL